MPAQVKHKSGVAVTIHEVCFNNLRFRSARSFRNETKIPHFHKYSDLILVSVKHLLQI